MRFFGRGKTEISQEEQQTQNTEIERLDLNGIDSNDKDGVIDDGGNGINSAKGEVNLGAYENEDGTRTEMDDNVLVVTPEQRRIHYIFREFTAVAKSPIEGIYVTPSSSDPLVWFGLLIVRSGIFYGGIFRFTLTLPADFPDTIQMPIVQFEDTLFHPLVNPRTRCVELNRHFPSGWQKDRNHVYQVLIATQSIFYSCHCDSSHAANPEAAILLKENKHKFVQLAHDIVRKSRTQVYAMPSSNDRNAIRFTPWNSEMEPFRRFLLGKDGLPSSAPLSMTSAMDVSTSSTISDAWLWQQKQQQNISGNSRKKAGFSWVDAENCRYMCDIFPPEGQETSKLATQEPEETSNGVEEENLITDTEESSRLEPKHDLLDEIPKEIQQSGEKWKGAEKERLI